MRTMVCTAVFLFGLGVGTGTAQAPSQPPAAAMGQMSGMEMGQGKCMGMPMNMGQGKDMGGMAMDIAYRNAKSYFRLPGIAD